MHRRLVVLKAFTGSTLSWNLPSPLRKTLNSYLKPRGSNVAPRRSCFAGPVESVALCPEARDGHVALHPSRACELRRVWEASS